MKKILLIFSILISFLFLEISLRLINYPYQNCETVYKTLDVEFDEVLGWKYLTNHSFLHSYGGTNSITEEGFRSLHKTDVIDERKKLVFIVGDSFLFGHGLVFEDTFGYQLNNLLGDSYQVVNFSVQAFGTDQIYLLMKRLLLEYNPDIIITNYIKDHDRRNLVQDRRYFDYCLEFSGTKPLFKVVDGKLEQIAKPKKYIEYDKIRIWLVLKKIADFKKLEKNESEGYNISHLFLDKMKKW